MVGRRCVLEQPSNEALPAGSVYLTQLLVGGQRSRRLLRTAELGEAGKAASYPGLEIIAKLATVLEVEPAELLKVPPGMPEHLRCR